MLMKATIWCYGDWPQWQH